jgi:hypothetical protein
VRRLCLPACLAFLALLVLLAPAAAARQWCMRDPIVALNGAPLQLWVGIPEEYVPLVNGPISVTYRVPARVTREVVHLDEGFNGFGEIVTFEDGTGTINAAGLFEVELLVIVPIDAERAAGIIAPEQVPLRLWLDDDGKRQRVITGINDGSWVTTRVKGTRP